MLVLDSRPVFVHTHSMGRKGSKLLFISSPNIDGFYTLIFHKVL